MNALAPVKSSVSTSAHMIELLNDTSLAKRIALVFPDIEKVIHQTQIDIVTPDNRDVVGPTILGIKHLQDVLYLFKVKGEALIAQETNTKK